MTRRLLDGVGAPADELTPAQAARFRAQELLMVADLLESSGQLTRARNARLYAVELWPAEGGTC